ncbi:MAG: glycosyltransferase family 4 protein [Anaerolineales bacterium]|nr:glycosyltransferase family 4 protein [Anaerolineales bacterium]
MRPAAHQSPQVVICRSNPIAPDPRVEKTARALVGAGYGVTILSWDRSGMMPPHEAGGGVQTIRLAIQAEYGHGLSNLTQLLRWQWGLLTWLARNASHYQVVHACDFDTLLPALFVRSFFKKRVIYDIFDFYADHLRATPNWIKKLVRWADLRAIGWADAVILADEARQEQIKGARPARLTVIYNTPDDRELSGEGAPDHQAGALTPGGGLRLAYVGLLQVERGLLEILQVLKCHPAWTLDLAGFGGDSERILGVAAEMPNVHWHGRVPYPQALRLAQAADVLLATYDPAIPNHRFSSPNKVFEGMMLGKPIVVAQGTNMDRIIESTSCGVVVPYGNVSVLEGALLQLENEPNLLQELGENGRKAYLARYSWAEMQRRLLALYSDIVRAET